MESTKAEKTIRMETDRFVLKKRIPSFSATEINKTVLIHRAGLTKRKNKEGSFIREKVS